MWQQTLQALIIAIVMIVASVQKTANEHPNIVIIMADDMGFDDVSFRGSNQFLTPNIDALAYSGVILKNLYVPAMCTPSRAALLTGKYPINTGMQHYVIPNDQPWGLPTNETTMAEIFQEHGYYTCLVGKWHLGMSRREYTPTQRGFDHHYGYLGAYIDYWDHTLYEPAKNFSRGHDFRNDMQVNRKHTGTYATDLITEEAVRIIERQSVSTKPLFLILSHLAPHSGNDDDPLQAPQEEISKFSYINDEKRRTYAAMVSALDKSVEQVITALSQQQMLNNTIILFYSDNGGPTLGMHANTASNYPLRGQKNTPWEGGVRSSGAIWSPTFEKLSTVWKQRIYIADFLPTLAAAAGITLPEQLQLDGLNLWSALKYGYESLEREVVHNIDDYYAFAKGKWKLVHGNTEHGAYDGWLAARNPHEIDGRATHYEQVIQETSVWQLLSKFNSNSSMVNIASLRSDAEVICQRKDIENKQEIMGCQALEQICLFDIDEDPCEEHNLYEQQKNTSFVQEMLQRIQFLRENAHQPNNKPSDPMCDPKYYNYEWTWWEQEHKSSNSSPKNLWFGLFLKIVCNFVILLLINLSW